MENPENSKAPRSSKKKLRIPLRVQITVLLVFFVLIVAVVSFQSTFSVLEQDKIGAIRDIQTLKASDFSRDLGDRIVKTRQEMRENALRLLDTERGALQLDEAQWRWLRVETKVWNSKSFESTKILSAQHEIFKSNEKKFFQAQLHPQNRKDIILEEPLRIVQGSQERILLIQAQVSLVYITGEIERISTGPIRGLVVDASSLDVKKLGSAEDFKKIVWGAEADALENFTQLILAVPDLVKGIAQPSKPNSRLFVNSNDQSNVLVSWASVPLIGTEKNIVAITFVNQSEILKAFFRKKVELAFWVFLVMGFGTIVASVMGRRMSKPIESIVSAASVLEKGDFGVRVDQSRGDELGDLGAAFNHMGATLELRDKELQAANIALIQNEKLAALGTLSAGLAHEVKNPLAGILGHADMTSQAIKKLGIPNQEVLLKHIETIQKETKRCRGIIDNLMKFSRNDGAKSASEFEHMDLEMCAWEAIGLNEHPLNLAKVKIEKIFSPDAWMIRGNSNQIEQVLLNMMQNAGHAMPKGGSLKIGTNFFKDVSEASSGELTSYTPADFKGPIMRIFVTDSGDGMTPEVQKKIFEPFFTTKPKGVGTGLGLAVTMQILSDHKARLSLTSAPGKGTTFFIDFMAVKARTQIVIDALKEITHHRSGGEQLSTDVNIAKKDLPPSTPTSTESESSKNIEVSGGTFADQKSVKTFSGIPKAPRPASFGAPTVEKKKSEDGHTVSAKTDSVPSDSIKPAPFIIPKPKVKK